ncbi:hypothetical protein I6H07_10780 [Hafnia alvei]|uniref:hypothetical protein n=1 Tax=Hafnia alvei TaxID=569 RepID=UPI000B6F8AFE|nr:hypothetical protein [Hafnia alvei]MBI0276283.1 hypothetical protein [Hafnia alvei]PNK97184.1 hypothetical protein CEQ28_005990 [Hafnia alvei]
MKRLLLAMLYVTAMSGCSSTAPEIAPYQQPVVQQAPPVIKEITNEQVKNLTNEYLAFCEKNINTYLDKIEYAPNTKACDAEVDYRLKHKKLTKPELNKDMDYAQDINEMNAKIEQQSKSIDKAISACYDNPVVCRAHETDRTLDEGGL